MEAGFAKGARHSDHSKKQPLDSCCTYLFIETYKEHYRYKMHKSLQITALRAMLARHDTLVQSPRDKIPLGIAGMDQLLGGGLAAGALHEVYAASARSAGAATGFALGLAARLMGETAPLIWIVQSMAIRENGVPYAPGLAEMGLDPNRLILVEATKEDQLLEAALQTLRGLTGGVALIEPYGEAKGLDLTAGRKLTLAAEASGTSLLLLKTQAAPIASAAATRWRVGASYAASGGRYLMGHPRFAVELLRSRQGQTGMWSVEWDNDERIFRNAAMAGAERGTPLPQSLPLSGAVAPLSRHRQSGADLAEDGLRRAG